MNIIGRVIATIAAMAGALVGIMPADSAAAGITRGQGR